MYVSHAIVTKSLFLFFFSSSSSSSRSFFFYRLLVLLFFDNVKHRIYSSFVSITSFHFFSSFDKTNNNNMFTILLLSLCCISLTLTATIDHQSKENFPQQEGKLFTIKSSGLTYRQYITNYGRFKMWASVKKFKINEFRRSRTEREKRRCYLRGQIME